MLEPPSPFGYQAVDALAELDELEKNYPTNGFDFLEAIKNIIAKFHDAHTYFYPPCFSTFAFVLPFSLSLNVDSNNVPQVYLSAKLSEASDFDGFRVEAIALDNATYPDNEAAWETLAAWAEQDIWVYRTPAAQLNAIAGAGKFTERPIDNMPAPTIGAVLLKLYNTTSGETIERSFEWKVYVTEDVPDMASICPLDSAGSLRSGRINSEPLSPEIAKEGNRLSARILERVHSRANSGNVSRKIKQEMRSVVDEELRKYIGEVVREGERLVERRLREKSKPMFLERKMRGPNNAHSVTAGRTTDNSEVSLQKLNEAAPLLTGVITPGNIGYIQIESFDIEDSDAFAKHIVEALSHFKANDIKNVAIDLVANGGGNIADSDILYRALFPDEFPVYSRRRVVNSTVGMLNNEGMGVVEYENPSAPKTDVFEKLVSVSHTGLGVTRTRNWTQPYAWNFDSEDRFDHYTKDTQYFHKRWYEPDNILVLTDGRCGSACSVFIKHIAETHAAKLLGYGSHWRRNESVNYDVGSFSGGNVISSDSVNRIRANLAAAVQSLIQQGLSESEEGAIIIEGLLAILDDLPSALPRKSAMMRITLTASFSFDPATPDDPLEFKILKPDSLTGTYPSYGSSLEERLQMIVDNSGMFDTCYEWEVHATESCLNYAEEQAAATGVTLPEHMSYGLPCNTETQEFETETEACVEAGCELGYYMSSNGSCIAAKYTWSTYNVTPCDFGQRTVVELQEVLECMRTLPLDKENENNSTVSTLLEWLESYASRDVMLNPPAPLTGAVDIVARLEEIDANTSYTNGYDFHRDIAHAINRMQDGHTVYTMPCSKAFVIALPMVFDIETIEDDFIVNLRPNPTANYSLYNYWLDTYNISATDLSGFTVTHISIPGLTDNSGEKPEVTLARFADHISLYLRGPAGRLSFLLNAFQYGFSLKMYEPQGPVVVTGVTSSSETKTISLPWLGEKNFTGRNLEVVCPLVTSAEDHVKEKTMDADGKIDRLQRNSVLYALTSELSSLMEDNPGDEYLQRVGRLLLQRPEFLSFLHNQINLHRPRFPEPESANPYGLQGRNVARSVNEKDTLYRMRNAAEEGVLLSTTSGYIAATLFPQNSTLYLYIPTFHIPNTLLTVAWIADLLSYVKLFLSLENGHLVIDLSGNGGGTAILGNLLSALLFPDSYPFLESETVPGSAVNVEMLEGDIDTGEIITYITEEPVTNILQLAHRNISVSSNSTTRTREWVGPYARRVGRFGEIASTLRLVVEFPDNYYISPQQIVLLTDGRCASTCCIFVKRSQELHLAKVAGLGANLVDDSGFDSGTACGGPVYDVDDLLGSLSQAPDAFRRSGTSFSFSAGNTDSFDISTVGAWLEYKTISTDSSHPYFKFYNRNPVDIAETRSLVSLVAQDWDTCADWEVKEAECTPSEQVTHGRYGYACNSTTHTFDQSVCVFARCESGYYLSASRKCTEIPGMVTETKSSQSKTTPTWAIIVIAIIGVLLLVAVAGLIVTLLCCRSRTGDSAKGREMDSSINSA